MRWETERRKRNIGRVEKWVANETLAYPLIFFSLCSMQLLLDNTYLHLDFRMIFLLFIFEDHLNNGFIFHVYCLTYVAKHRCYEFIWKKNESSESFVEQNALKIRYCNPFDPL